jgi:hypothetical protein
MACARAHPHQALSLRATVAELRPRLDWFFPNEDLRRRQAGRPWTRLERGRHELKIHLLAPSTWAGYARIWRKAWGFFEPRLARRVLPTVEALHACDDVVHEYFFDMHGRASLGKTVMKKAMEVVNFAFKLHDLPSKAWQGSMKTLRKADGLTRGRAVRKKEPAGVQLLQGIAQSWDPAGRGARSALWRRTVSVCANVMHDCAIRCDSMLRIQDKKLFWLRARSPSERGGVLIGTAISKQNQAAEPVWIAIADMGTATCTYARLRALLADRGRPQPLHGCAVALPGVQHLWPLMRPTKDGYRLEETALPLLKHLPGVKGSQGYNRFRLLFKAALAAIGIPKDVRGRFSTHSMRRGGDTDRFTSGLSQDERMILGGWASPDVEAGYVALQAAAHLALVSGAQMA